MPGLAIVLAAAVTYFAVGGLVDGAKKVVHGVQHVAAHVLHPHRSRDTDGQ